MKRLLLSILFTLTTSCYQSDKFIPDQKSFAFIITRTQEEKKCDSSGTCKVKISTSSGSGIVIKSLTSNTQVLTAGHVCEMVSGAVHSLAVIDSVGTIHNAIDAKISAKPDLCLIKTAGQWGVPVKISNGKLKYGDSVISMAAPTGIFEPKMILLFDGRYAGRTSENDDVFTLPCAPGSSGSAVLNRHGEIVSIVHSAAKNFQNMAIGSNTKDIKIFLNKLVNF